MKILREAKISDLVTRAQPNPRWQRKNNYSPRVIEYTLNPLYVVFKVGKYEVDLAYNKDCKTPEDVRQTLMSDDVHIDCQCKDFHYRFRYYANVNNFGLKPEHRPSKITNPHDTLGPNCKHIDAVFAQGKWKRDLIRDCENNMPTPITDTDDTVAINNNPDNISIDTTATTDDKPKDYNKRLVFNKKKNVGDSNKANTKEPEKEITKPETTVNSTTDNNNDDDKQSFLTKIKNKFLKFGKNKDKDKGKETK